MFVSTVAGGVSSPRGRHAEHETADGRRPDSYRPGSRGAHELTPVDRRRRRQAAVALIHDGLLSRKVLAGTLPCTSVGVKDSGWTSRLTG